MKHMWSSLIMGLLVCIAGCHSDWRAEYVELQAEVSSGSGARHEALVRMAEATFVPAGERTAARPYRQDAYYQLARTSEDPAEQLELANDGLSLGGDDLFVANLLAVKGRALEALGRVDEAPAVYHRALLINEQLLNELLNEIEP